MLQEANRDRGPVAGTTRNAERGTIHRTSHYEVSLDHAPHPHRRRRSQHPADARRRCCAPRAFVVGGAPTGHAGLLAVDEPRARRDLPRSHHAAGTRRAGHAADSSASEAHRAPVIMMSGKAQLADAVRAAQLGAFQFLEKPLSPEAVLVTLRAALELGRTRQPEPGAAPGARAAGTRWWGRAPPLRQVRRAGGAGGPDRRAGADHRGIGDRQGAGGRRHPPRQPAGARSRSSR